jgi:L-threonylcarbamoyladenylate synthase
MEGTERAYIYRGWRVHGWDLVRAARALAAGGVIAYPTEAVFGIGCDPWNEMALLCLVRLKRRPLCKGFIVIAGAHEDLSGLVTYPDPEVRGRVLATWPGPVTWVLPACPGVSRRLTGGRRGLAVRVTAHPVAAALCRRVGPLVSTSANPGACVPAASAARVRGYFRAELDYIVPGEVGGARSVSEIRDALSGAVLRSASAPGGAGGH